MSKAMEWVFDSVLVDRMGNSDVNMFALASQVPVNSLLQITVISFYVCS